MTCVCVNDLCVGGECAKGGGMLCVNMCNMCGR